MAGSVAITGDHLTLHGKSHLTGDVDVTGKVDLVGAVGITGDVTLHGKSHLTGDVGITGGNLSLHGDFGIVGDMGIEGDLVLNGISLAEISSSHRPTEVVVRNCNPMCPGMVGGEIPPERINEAFPITGQSGSNVYPYNFFGGWAFNNFGESSSTKINWYFLPGQNLAYNGVTGCCDNNTCVKDFRGFAINLMGYSEQTPFVTVYTYPVSGNPLDITPSTKVITVNGNTTTTQVNKFYQNKFTYTIDPLTVNFAYPPYKFPGEHGTTINAPYSYSITYGEYPNSLTRGYNEYNATMVSPRGEVDADGFYITTADPADIPNEKIFAYTVQTSSGYSYSFVAVSATFTEYRMINDLRQLTSYNNMLTQIY